MVRIAAQTLAEIVFLMAVSVAVGLGVNTVRQVRKDHERAVVLKRNYFARASVAPVAPVPGPEALGASPAAATPATGFSGEHLGIHLARFEEVRDRFENPEPTGELSVFVDARDQGLFDSGHIPGALLVDHYRSDRYLPEVLDIILSADRVIVYCHSSDCEDSVFLSQTLIENGIEPDRIFVFQGGFEEWEAQGMPVEKTEPSP